MTIRDEPSATPGDREALAVLRDETGGQDRATVVAHYLYCPDEAAGHRIAAQLVAQDFDVESRLGADDVNWLVLARHVVTPDEDTIGRARAMFEALARSVDGDYDGWEAQVRSQEPAQTDPKE